MGLEPSTFWSLTPREFWIKHQAFSRSEDRMQSLVLQLAELVGQFSKKDQAMLERYSKALRRYPLKKWLLPNRREI